MNILHFFRKMSTETKKIPPKFFEFQENFLEKLQIAHTIVL